MRDGDGNPVEGVAPVWNPDTREITVELGDIGPGESYTVDYDGTVTGDAVLPGGDIGAAVEAEGQNPDGTPHGDVDAGKVYPGGSDGSGTSGVDDPGDGRVVPVPVAPELTKEARNLQREGEASHVGDVIEYTIRCSAGPTGTLWRDVKITDEVPRDLAVDASSIAFSDWAGNALEGAAWDESSHTLTAAVGDLYGAGGRFAASQQGRRGRSRAVTGRVSAGLGRARWRCGHIWRGGGANVLAPPLLGSG